MGCPLIFMPACACTSHDLADRCAVEQRGYQELTNTRPISRSAMEYSELIRQHELTEEDCSQQVSDDHLESLSRSHRKLWERLPAHLGRETTGAKDISQKLINEEEKRYNFLLSWKQIKGSRATYSSELF